MIENNTYRSDTVTNRYAYRTPVDMMDECNRVSYGLTIDDFNTSFVNPHRVDKMIREVENYLRYKRKYQE